LVEKVNLKKLSELCVNNKGVWINE